MDEPILPTEISRQPNRTNPRLRWFLIKTAIVAVPLTLLYYLFTYKPPSDLQRHDQHRPVFTNTSQDEQGPIVRVHPTSLLNLTFTLEASLTRAIVVASTHVDNVSWLSLLPSSPTPWNIFTFVNDDPAAPLTVSRNKGNEGAAYLSYIIDNYHSLPNVILFLHGHRYQWHNDEPLYDHLPLISAINTSYVVEVGYTALRCTWYPGCPVNLRPTELQHHEDPWSYEREFAAAWSALFPDEAMPEAVGAPCCAQFAVTGDVIRQRPVDAYERLRTWLWSTELEQHKSGRILEYVWHILFQQAAVSCPRTDECFCRLYGLCELQCLGEGSCQGRWWPPWPLEKLDAHWPEVGQGERGWPVKGWDTTAGVGG